MPFKGVSLSLLYFSLHESMNAMLKTAKQSYKPYSNMSSYCYLQPGAGGRNRIHIYFRLLKYLTLDDDP